MKIRVDYYEVQRYEVKYRIRGIWYTKTFYQEETALKFIDEKYTLEWEDYFLIKISNAIF